ncbi:MAG TPA: helix-turn-helix transcriptional regulator [Kribbella sp.]|nr:helix-turn-helix transcriptional regulator [Kribbella sp.]
MNAWPWEPFTRGRPDSAALSMRRALFLAEAARCRGDADQVDRWERAIEACETAGAPWHRAVSQWRCAEAAVAAGRPPAGVGALLRSSHRCAVELGAKPLQDEIESLALRLRTSLREPVPLVVPAQAATPLSTLTAREREVLALLVAGRSNGEIAKELVISDKTASVHVSNILRKTGTGSRLEAAALASRLGGPGA